MQLTFRSFAIAPGHITKLCIAHDFLLDDKQPHVTYYMYLNLMASGEHIRHLHRMWLSPPLDNIRVMVTVWRLRRNITGTALCWIV